MVGRCPPLAIVVSVGEHAFLERSVQLEALRGALDSARRGGGRLTFVGGEAGIGKTALVDRFCRDLPGGTRVFRGACDAIATPRPLGPLLDMALDLGTEFAAAVDDERPAELFDAFFRRLCEGGRPTVVVIEDVHWADDGTLDLLRFLGRRVARANVLVLATYRDTELTRGHPLRIAMGDLATVASVERIAVPPLSLEAVRRMAGARTIDAEELHRRTAGNPFFVTEVLEAAQDAIPATVVDAVGARVARLEPTARAALEVLSAVGGPVGASLLSELGLGDAADRCVEVGLLEVVDGRIVFRHALVRDAIYRGLGAHRRREMHGRILAALEGGTVAVDVSVLAYHAVAADDGTAILGYAPAAGLRAAQLGAHKEAHALYGACLPYLEKLPEEGRATLLEAYATECTITDRLEESAEARRDAVGRWRRLGRPLRVGLNLSILAQVEVGLGKDVEADGTSTRAVALLEEHAPGPELARATWFHAHLRALDHDVDGAVAWGERALELAERLGDVAMAGNTHMTIGRALLQAGRPEGRTHLERSIALGREHDLPNLTGSATGFLGLAACEHYRLPEATARLTEAIALTEESGHDNLRGYFLAWLALARLRAGAWDAATDAAHTVLDRPVSAAESRALALGVLAIIRARRGDPDAAGLLDEAAALLGSSTALQRLAPFQAARAEVAWFIGDLVPVTEGVVRTLAVAVKRRHPWYAGELAYWLTKASGTYDAPLEVAEPYALQLAGRSAEAVSAWERLGCPYEAARAAADGGGEAGWRSALATFLKLGAEPAAQRAAAELRLLGARAIPRGPRATTRFVPAHLTPRELQVLRLLATGLRNTEIADRHGVSTRTVDHQVSSILAKLEARSRTEAVARGRELGLLDPT